VNPVYNKASEVDFIFEQNQNFLVEIVEIKDAAERESTHGVMEV